tara:strand:- start:1093 stop:1536 length:444 start_codon:yes stop_codon:yes gene_type:complete
MSWFTELFSDATAKVVDSIGNAIDRNVTSQEERDKLKLELEKEMNSIEKAYLEAIASNDKEVSNRHKYDMKSDSWLSKNIRPLALAFLTVTTMILAYLTIFTLETAKVALVDPWLDLLQVLLITTYSFYFGSRGFEKVQAIKARAAS